MSTIHQTNNRRGFLSFWQRQAAAHEVTGYEVGDIHSDESVHVAVGSTLVGNIIAPQVTVAGLLTGHVVTQTLTIQSGGQLWGNVYTITCQIEMGGQLQGWVTAVDEENYKKFHAEGTVPNGAQSALYTELPTDAPPTVLASRQPGHLTALQQLQGEVAAALAARAELEQDFDRRLSEVAGDATTRIATLQAELTEANEKLATLQHETTNLRDSLGERNEQIQRQTNELNETRDLLEERKKELLTTRDALDERNQRFDELFAAKIGIDDQLKSALSTNEALNERIHSLETALQGSLLHTSEQEESLIRWQELAEVTEKKVHDLEKEIGNMRLNAEEAANTIELLREQRRQTEKELEDALAELTELRQKSTKPLTSETIVQMQMQLVDLEEKAQEYYEQMLWFKANAETTRAALEETRQQANHQEKRLEQLTTEVATKQALVDKWKAEMAKIRQVAMDQEKKLHSMQESLSATKVQASDSINAMREKALQAQLKQEASDIDFNRLQKETQAQGRRLAEIQALLVERELQLGQARQLIEKQRLFIQEMKQVTGQRINQLRQKLTEAQQFNKEIS